MNVRLLRRIQKQILKEPLQFAIETFFNDSRSDGLPIPNCGTTACIAGWAIALDRHKTPAQVERLIRRSVKNEFSNGQELIGISANQAARLFSSQFWPKKFRKLYMDATTPPGKSRAAVLRIDHFIKTKGAQ